MFAVSTLALVTITSASAFAEKPSKVKKTPVECGQQLWPTFTVPPGDMTVACSSVPQSIEVIVVQIAGGEKVVSRATLPLISGSTCLTTDRGEAMIQRGETVNPFRLDSKELGQHLDWGKLALKLALEPGEDGYDWLDVLVGMVWTVHKERLPRSELGITGLGSLRPGLGTGGFGIDWAHAAPRRTCVVESDALGVAVPQIVTRAPGFKIESVVMVKRLIADRCLAGLYIERKSPEETADKGE